MNFFLLRTFDNYISAHIAMGRLQEDGINCWLKDENTVTIDPILTNAIGGIKLMVDSLQSEKAAAILRTIDNEYKAAHPCPKCNSLNIELVSTLAKRRIGSVLLLASCLPVMRRRLTWFIIVLIAATNILLKKSRKAAPADFVFSFVSFAHNIFYVGSPYCSFSNIGTASVRTDGHPGWRPVAFLDH